MWSLESVGSILYLAVFGTAFTFVTITVLLRELPTVTVSFISMIIPFGALALGALIRDEPVTALAVAGALLVVAGIGVAQFRACKDALMPSIVVLGARNLGGAILGHHLNRGWRGAAVARSPETLETVRAAGGLPLQADASDPEQLRAALEQARAELGRLDVIVNAVSRRAADASPARSAAARSSEATVEDFRGWTGAVAEQAFVFLSEGVRAEARTLIQVTGGSARRAMPGRGLWAAGAAATRALVHAAAQELRDRGRPRRAADRRRHDRLAEDGGRDRRQAGERDRRPGRDRARRRVPRRPERARLHARARRHPRRRPLGALDDEAWCRPPSRPAPR